MRSKEELDKKAITEFDLKDLFDELEKDAYDIDFHGYHYKEANQIIRKHFEKRDEYANEVLKDFVGYLWDGYRIGHSYTREMVIGFVDEYLKEKEKA